MDIKHATQKNTFEALLRLVPQKLVVQRQHPLNPNLVLLKYSKQAFFRQAWRQYPILQFARGHVFDRTTGAVVVPAFRKIFNYGEPGAEVAPSGGFRVAHYIRKVNGFLGVVTRNNLTRELLYTTTGSFDSEYVQRVQDMVDVTEFHRIADSLDYVGQRGHTTLLYEICHPDDPHIIVEQTGAYLIGLEVAYGDPNELMINSTAMPGYTFLDAVYNQPGMNLKNTKRFFTEDGGGQVLEDFIAEHQDCRHEGFMIQTTTGEHFKWKSPYYRNNKFIARCGAKLEKVWQGSDADVRQAFSDEELWPIIDYLRGRFACEEFMAGDEQTRLAWLREFTG